MLSRHSWLASIAVSLVFAAAPAAATAQGSVASLTLVNADSDLDLFALADGMTIDLANLPTIALNVRADTIPDVVGSVRFDYDGIIGFQVESTAPYALAGDSAGDFDSWTPSLGSHSLAATPFSGAGTSGSAGPTVTVNLTVIDGQAPPPGTGDQVLVFHETAGFNHGSQITAGLAMFTSLAASHGFVVEAAAESTGFFTPTALAEYAAVVFLNTTGDVLDNSEQAAFEGFVALGGGYLGIHSATDTEYGWPFYGAHVGAWFSNHPPGTVPAQLTTIDATHPSTELLPTQFSWTDEWYNFQSNPANDPSVIVLVTIDETTYSGGTMGIPHPISWCREPSNGGRSWYTAMGHNVSTYSQTFFRDHILGGLEWVMNTSPEEAFVRGDGNGDGQVNVADAIFTLGILFTGVAATDCADARDANDDGQVDISDPVGTLVMLFGGGSSLPPPGSVCGIDPTLDLLDCPVSGCP